jgi:hypothetical protein
VLPAWATVVLTLGGVLLGVIGGLAGVGLQNRHSHKQREADKLDERRVKGAEVVAPVRALLTHFDVYSMVVPLHPDIEEDWQAAFSRKLEAIVDRWQRLRDPLLIYTAGHPSADVVAIGSELVDSATRTFRETWLAQKARLTHSSVDQTLLEGALERAAKSHEKALALVYVLLPLVRGEEVDLESLERLKKAMVGRRTEESE